MGDLYGLIWCVTAEQFRSRAALCIAAIKVRIARRSGRESDAGAEQSTRVADYGDRRRRRKVAITFAVSCAAPSSLRRRFPIVRIALLLFRDRPSRYERDTRTSRPTVWSRLVGGLGPREWQHASV